MKTIGVLGGFGPQATMDLEARIHRVSQGLIPPDRNGGYPPMVVFYCRYPPVLVNEAGMPREPVRVDPRLLDAARALGGMSDFLVVPSNGIHLFREQIERASGRPLVSMVDATIGEVRRREWQSVGVLGLGRPVVYTAPLGRLGIRCETVAEELQAPLDVAIFRVMEGRHDADDAAALRRAVTSLLARGVDGVILGCTELPLLLPGADDELYLLNPTELLAQAAVEAALRPR